MPEQPFSDIEKRAEQFILQMVRYWSENLQDPNYLERGIGVDSGGMHIPYRMEVLEDDSHVIKSDVSGDGWSQRGFYEESSRRSR
jgi:hypothetical protein